ncbi:MAG TPA: hypothetical protein VF535_05185 [Allosphingosinicella sp.]|jgi:Spy/CpxP family protein refolding chaperone
MRIRTLTAALTAAAMVCTSAPSFAQAAPEPAASVEDGAALSHEGVEHRKRRGTMWAVLGFVVIVVAALLLFTDDGDEGPISA